MATAAAASGGSVGEMGMLSWLLVDVAINVAGWAAAATLKVWEMLQVLQGNEFDPSGLIHIFDAVVRVGD